MNQLTPLTLALLLLASVSSLALVVAQNKSPKDNPVAASADPFSVVIAAEWPSEKVGSDLAVIATITNTSAKKSRLLILSGFATIPLRFVMMQVKFRR